MPKQGGGGEIIPFKGRTINLFETYKNKLENNHTSNIDIFKEIQDSVNKQFGVYNSIPNKDDDVWNFLVRYKNAFDRAFEDAITKPGVTQYVLNALYAWSRVFNGVVNAETIVRGEEFGRALSEIVIKELEHLVEMRADYADKDYHQTDQSCRAALDKLDGIIDILNSVVIKLRDESSFETITTDISDKGITTTFDIFYKSNFTRDWIRMIYSYAQDARIKDAKGKLVDDTKPAQPDKLDAKRDGNVIDASDIFKDKDKNN